MNEFKTVFRTFAPQSLHIVALPFFFYAFCLTYRPYEIETFLNMGRLRYDFHLTMLTCILLVSVAITRVLLHFVKNIGSSSGRYDFSLSDYIFWCFAEMLLASMFMGLYIWLFKKPAGTYFGYVAWSMLLSGSSCVFPYVILYLSLTSYSRGHRHLNVSEDEKLRFHDEKNNLKFVVAAEAILYITAEENYVRIFYLDGVREREYLLRNTMKSIIELCSRGGLVRCHRSYYVNPRHVKILGKNSEGVLHAVMDDSKASPVPVSKRYYEELLALL